jgi:hypothetical protein
LKLIRIFYKSFEILSFCDERLRHKLSFEQFVWSLAATWMKWMQNYRRKNARKREYVQVSTYKWSKSWPKRVNGVWFCINKGEGSKNQKSTMMSYIHSLLCLEISRFHLNCPGRYYKNINQKDKTTLLWKLNVLIIREIR